MTRPMSERFKTKRPATTSSKKAVASSKGRASASSSSKKQPQGKPLWAHQKRTLTLAKKHPRLFDTSDPGTGKTRAHLEVFSQRRKRKGGKALVIAPKSLLETAWQNDAAEYVPHIRTSVAYAENRAEAFAVDADIYITNTDATKWLAAQPKRFFKDFDTIIVDESSYFKHRTSQRSKALAKIVEHFRYRVLLTGTPNSNTILDIWHQIFLLDDGVRLGSSFFRFREAVCTPKQVGPKANMIKWVDKEGAEFAVSGLIKDITIRNKFEDCMDIPPNHMVPVSFTLPKKLMAQYQQLKAETVLLLKERDVVAVNAAVLRNKLLQLCSGAVYTQGGAYEVLDTSRYELVAELIMQRQHSITFFNWAHQKHELSRLLTQLGVTHEVIDGDTPVKKRKAVVDAYQAGFYQTVLLHPQTGAHGLTLTKGTATIWCSPVYQADFLKQGLHRVYRGGQTLPTETVMVQAKGTVEGMVFERLNEKSARMVDLLDMLEGDS